MATQEEIGVATREDGRECALIKDVQQDTSSALVPYRGNLCLELSWEADRAWSVLYMTHTLLSYQTVMGEI